MWVRSLLVLGLAYLYVWKTLRLPTRILIWPIRQIVENWTFPMYRAVIGSWVTRAYIDQPCDFVVPEEIKPLAEVPPEYRFSEQELRQFYEDGFLGPFDGFKEDEIRELGRQLLERRAQPSETFGFPTDRDLHLELPLMREFMCRPAIVDRVAQFLGPDLLCWRSQVFYKPPGSLAIQWHQASTYMLEDYLEPVLKPADRDALFQLTVWVAVDPATVQNGCLQFIPGTHDRIRKIKLGGEKRFYKASFDLEFDNPQDEVVSLPVKPGQFLIFTERVIHGSGPNQTETNRLAFNFRCIRPDVRVYGGQRSHRAIHMGQTYDLEKWGMMVLRGEDRLGLNRKARFNDRRDPVLT